MQQNDKKSIKIIERKVKKGIIYTITPFFEASMPRAT